MCLGITGVAMVFGAVAAVTAQLWRQARTATGAAMGVLALAALVRGVGDVIDNSGSALSWFSPIAWAQQMRAFVDLRWWPFALLVVLTIALMGCRLRAGEQARSTTTASSRRAVSTPNARPITGVFGLHLTLQRGQTIGWAVGLFLGGLAFGSMTKSLLDAAKGNELLQRVLAQQGNDGVYTTMTQFLAAAATAYVVSAVLRVSTDEESGLGEAVLAGAVSRWRWLLTAVAPTLVGSAVLMFFAGLGNGLGAGITLGEPQTIRRLTLAGAGLRARDGGDGRRRGARRRGAACRGSVGLQSRSSSYRCTSGALLRLPRWLIDLSPVGRTTAPSEYPVVALTVMVVVAAALTAARRRDLSPSRRNLGEEESHEDRAYSSDRYTVFGIVVFGVLLFWPAGTFDYWQAWVFIAVFVDRRPSIPTIYLAVKSRDALSAACTPGPSAETGRCKSSSMSASS